MGWPATTGLGLALASSVRSAKVLTAIGSEALLLDWMRSGVELATRAVLVMLDAASATCARSTKLEVAPDVRVTGWVQVTTCPAGVQDQSAPPLLTESKLSPAGSVSVTVMGPAASRGPLLCTSMLSSPVWPAVNEPKWLRVSCRSA